MHARFDALDRYFRATLGAASGWSSWPEEFRDVNGSAARRFAAEHPAEVEFYAYLQWLAHEQLCGAQALDARTRHAHRPLRRLCGGRQSIGFGDLGGPASYALMGAEIGAPPDPLALKGQGWGIPPQDPSAMQAQRLQGFVRLIRNNMRYYGALRLDHVMSLFRLWWVAGGCSPTEGAYVHYPLQQLLTVLALESARSRLLGGRRGLGVVPDEMRRAMPEFGLYHYKVLLFEKAGRSIPAPGRVCAARSGDRHHARHADVAQLLGRAGHRTAPALESLSQRGSRKRSRSESARTIASCCWRPCGNRGLNPAQPATPLEPFTAELAHALQLYLARSPTLLVALQIEDLLGLVDPVNVPGTRLRISELAAQAQRRISRKSRRAAILPRS